jgi:hypothetical protein
VMINGWCNAKEPLMSPQTNDFSVSLRSGRTRRTAFPGKC